MSSCNCPMNVYPAHIVAADAHTKRCPMWKKPLAIGALALALAGTATAQVDVGTTGIADNPIARDAGGRDFFTVQASRAVLEQRRVAFQRVMLGRKIAELRAKR